MVADDVQRRLVTRSGATVRYSYRHVLSGFAATMSVAAARQLAADPAVASVEPDGAGTGGATQLYPPSWGLDRVDQRTSSRDGRYMYWTTGAGVHVYVLDSGIRRTHIDFGGRATIDADFVGDGQNGNDCLGHGTHVADTIGGTTYGVAKAVRLHAVRIIDCTNSVSWSTAIAALDWVRANAQRPAVVNMSFWGTPSASLDTAVNNLIQSGITAVTIASDTASATMTGTSMAAPHVAGVVARFLQRTPTATPAQLANTVLTEATRDVITGAGTGTPNRLLFSDQALTGQQVVTASFTVNPGQGWDTVATCPAGTTVTGGGYFHNSTPNIEIDVSAPLQSGWHVHALNGTSAAVTVYAYAVCASVPAQQVVTVQYTVAPGLAGLDVSCPADRDLIGGGFWHDSTFGVAVNRSIPAQYNQLWHLEVLNGLSTARILSAYAVCAQSAGQTVTTSQFTIQPGQGWDTVARCPAGTAVTGGGHVLLTGTSTATFRVAIDISAPLSQGWHVHGYNTDSQPQTVVAYAVCVASR